MGLELRALATGRCSGQLEVRGGISGPIVHGSGTAGPGNWPLFWPAEGKRRDFRAHCHGAGTAVPVNFLLFQPARGKEEKMSGLTVIVLATELVLSNRR
jgi:hypothetical protein